ncbi:hypothetical protein [Streptomyces exfoliatus]|uniref:hypothetical protein n=1 Tax=Streptomyces exfoliatus TaxID=1905 RepID=UPI003C2AFE2F
MRRTLSQAGFHLVSERDGGGTGLRVKEVPEGVAIIWAASDGFTALASKQTGPSNDSLEVIVHAAVTGLIAQLGHTVTKPPHGATLLILPQTPEPNE